MPFTSDLMGRYGNNPLAITFFGINLIALSLTTQWIFLYAAGHHLLVDATRSAHDELAARIRFVLVIGIVALSLLLAWTNLSKYVWVLFLFVPMIGHRLAEVVERKRKEESTAART